MKDIEPDVLRFRTVSAVSLGESIVMVKPFGVIEGVAGCYHGPHGAKMRDCAFALMRYEV